MSNLTGIQIILGQFCDGGSHPPLSLTHAQMGALVLGPEGFLEWLETRLGLLGPPVSAPLRISQYFNGLTEVDDGDRFYSRSFQANGWLTARELLSWRDALILGGWKGDPLQNGGPRLEALAQVEEVLHKTLSPGFADRMARLREALQTDVDPVSMGWERLELVESEEEWPPWWRDIFARLAEGVEIRVRSGMPPMPTGDLGRARARISGGPSTPYQQDDSLVLIDGANASELAEVLAAWLANPPPGSMVLVAPERSELLDRVFKHAGLPGPGVQSPMPSRTTLEILPAALATFWSPVDVHALLNWLSLPLSPLPVGLRHRLAQTVAAVPGVKGPDWHAAIATAREREWERLERDETDPARRKRRMTDWEDRVAFWLDHPYFDPSQGMPRSTAEAIAERIQNWAIQRHAVTGEPLLIELAQCVSEWARVVNLLHQEQLSRIELERIWDSVLGPGVIRTDAPEESAPWGVVHHPGAVYDPVETVVWWGFQQTARPSFRPVPWTPAELDALDGAHILWEPTEAAVNREASAWAQPIRRAAKQVLWFSAREPAGEKASFHPLWDELVSGDDHPQILKAEPLLQSEHTLLTGRRLARQPVTPLLLPPPRGIWPLAPGRVPPRAVESATSIEALLGCSFHWVLRYAAAIQPAESLQIQEEPLMVGSLVHAVVSRLIAQNPQWEPEAAADAARGIFDDLVPQMAAPLLRPELKGDLVRIRTQVGRAIASLYRLLARERLQIPTQNASEWTLEQPWTEDRSIRGTLDLIGEDERGRRVLLDLKWSTSKRYRALVESGQAVQLAVYHQLLQSHYPVTRAGYFLLKNGQDVWMSDTEAAETWARTEQAYRARMMELESHATATGLAAGTASADLLTLEPPCRFCPYGTLCGMGRVS